jgi:hypothetical protein
VIVVAFLTSLRYFPAFPGSTTFDIIVGCLRLSHKYEVDYLRRRALIHLSSQYRTTLSEWDSREYEQPALSPSKISWEPPPAITFVIRLIELAREVDVLWVLPTAFYELACSFNKPSDFPDSLGVEIFHGAVYNGTSTRLSEQDQRSFLKGHVAHIRSGWDILEFLSYPTNIESCTSPDRCRIERLTVLGNNEMEGDLWLHIPLAVWNEDDWYLLGDLCTPCITALRKHHQDARQKLWNKLPSMYDLPSWDELERMKVAAIGDPFEG